jgi:hypothetical protein
VDLRWDSGCFWWIREDWVFDSALIRWELLEGGFSDLGDPANGKLRGKIIGGLKVFWCWPMAAVDITLRLLESLLKRD